MKLTTFFFYHNEDAEVFITLVSYCYSDPEGVLPIMTNTGRLRPRGVPFPASGK